MNTVNNPFRKYRDTLLKMESDPRVKSLRDTIQLSQDKLEDAERPYREALSVLEDEIKATVMDHGDTVEQYGVEGKYSERRSTSWKSVALEFDPPDELVEKHTKLSQWVKVVFKG